MIDKEEKTGWDKALDYMKLLRHGPPMEDLETAHILGTFFEFLTIQLLAVYVAHIPPDEREKFMDTLRKGWTTMLHQHVNERVKEHQDVLDSIPDGKHLAMFIGDGEHIRLEAMRRTKAAQKKVKELLQTLAKRVDELEGE